MDEAQRSRRCSVCKHWNYAPDLNGPYCLGCYERILARQNVTVTPRPAIAHCDRCRRGFATYRTVFTICAECAGVPLRWEKTTRTCSGKCGRRFRPARNNGRLCGDPECRLPLRRARSVALAAARRVGRHSLQEWLDLVHLAGGRCSYCNRKTALTKDHVIPISNGGSDAIANIVPACRSCNSSKGTRDADEFAASLGTIAGTPLNWTKDPTA